MHINNINNYNQSFTSFRVTKRGAKELANKFAKNPEYEKKFVESIIMPLSYVVTKVIYDGNNQVFISPAQDPDNYYLIPDRSIYNGGKYTNFILRDTHSGDFTGIPLETQDVKEDIIDMEDIDNKLEFAKRMAKEFDVNNRYYEACHFENDIHLKTRYNENKLNRLYLID